MDVKASITVLRSPEETERLWREWEHHPDELRDAPDAVSFRPAPGDRGTEIHVDLEHETSGGRLGELLQKVTGIAPRAHAKDDLRHFKAWVETGEVPRSDGSPEGERAERKLKQRPAQPLADDELEKAAAR